MWLILLPLPMSRNTILGSVWSLSFQFCSQISVDTACEHDVIRCVWMRQEIAHCAHPVP